MALSFENSMHSIVSRISPRAKPFGRKIAVRVLKIARLTGEYIPSGTAAPLLPKDNRTTRSLEARSLAFMRLTGLKSNSTASFSAVHNPFL